MSVFLTKKDMVYTDIKRKILKGELKPGDRLHIRSIAKEYGISEIPVREAIQSLEHDRLVQNTPHTGAVVALQTPEDLQEILQLRVYLEGLATRLAASHMTPQIIAELESIVQQQEALLAESNLDDLGKLNTLFHETIYKYNPNRRLHAIILNLRDNNQRYHAFFKHDVTYTKGSIEEHRAIVQALKEGDAEKAQALMTAHREHSANQVLNTFLAEWESGKSV